MKLHWGISAFTIDVSKDLVEEGEERNTVLGGIIREKICKQTCFDAKNIIISGKKNI